MPEIFIHLQDSQKRARNFWDFSMASSLTLGLRGKLRDKKTEVAEQSWGIDVLGCWGIDLHFGKHLLIYWLQPEEKPQEKEKTHKDWEWTETER